MIKKNNTQSVPTINDNNKDQHGFKDWCFGTVNIRSGKEKSEGAKIYQVAKEIDSKNLLFCCIQEVKYIGSGKKLIRLDNGACFEFHWCGMKKKERQVLGFLYVLILKLLSKAMKCRTTVSWL